MISVLTIHNIPIIHLPGSTWCYLKDKWIPFSKKFNSTHDTGIIYQPLYLLNNRNNIDIVQNNKMPKALPDATYIGVTQNSKLLMFWNDVFKTQKMKFKYE